MNTHFLLPWISDNMTMKMGMNSTRLTIIVHTVWINGDESEWQNDAVGEWAWYENWILWISMILKLFISVVLVVSAVPLCDIFIDNWKKEVPRGLLD